MPLLWAECSGVDAGIATGRKSFESGEVSVAQALGQGVRTVDDGVGGGRSMSS